MLLLLLLNRARRRVYQAVDVVQSGAQVLDVAWVMEVILLRVVVVHWDVQGVLHNTGAIANAIVCFVGDRNSSAYLLVETGWGETYFVVFSG